jgi:hypothetical protein
MIRLDGLGGMPEVRKGYLELRAQAKRRYVAPLQLALAHLAVKDSRLALQEIKRSCNEHHPLMAWLHIWPIFKTLHHSRQFKALVERMNLPPSR